MEPSKAFGLGHPEHLGALRCPYGAPELWGCAEPLGPPEECTSTQGPTESEGASWGWPRALGSYVDSELGVSDPWSSRFRSPRLGAPGILPLARSDEWTWLSLGNK